MTIFYKFEGKIYANITNRCPCDCRFCIRQGGDSIAGNESLWLEHEPDIDEIKAAFDGLDKENMNSVVFCGYGEPMERAETLIETARYIKENYAMKIRVNTNGLISLIDPRFDVAKMVGVVDSVSVSLNASTAAKYCDITRPSFGEKAFDAMISFARSAKALGLEVGFTVVDMGGMDEEIAKCRRLADSLDIPLRVRAYVTDNESYT